MMESTESKLVIISVVICTISLIITVGLAIDRQNKLNELQKEISDFNISVIEESYGIYFDKTVYVHEDGTLYNCSELKQVMGDTLAWCDDFENFNTTWTSTQITNNCYQDETGQDPNDLVMHMKCSNDSLE